MAENLGASFSIDVTNLKAGLKTANAMIRESESEFKKAAAGMDDWSKSEDGLQKKIESLNKIQDLQKQKVNALTAEYNKMIKEGLDPTSDKAVKLRTQINNEETALNKTRTEIKNTTTALQNLDSESDKTETELGQLKTETDKASGGFGAMDVALGNLVASGIKSAIKGFQDLAKFAVDAYKAVDEGGDNVIKATGATGKEAEALQESYKNVAKTFKGDFSEIGTVLGEVNTRFGYTGEELEETTKQFLRFADITGTDAKTAVANVSKALKAAGLEDKDYTKLLDQMALAAQKSGISVDTLTEGLTKNGSTFRAMGFDTESTIAILSQFETAGVNTETVLAGMKTAAKNWATEGKNAKDEFSKAITEIASAPTEVEKTQKAMEIFGKKAGTEVADAVSTARINYADFISEMQNSEGTVKTTYETTKDAFDDFDILIQNVKTDFADFTSDVMSEYGPELKEGFKVIGDAIKSVIGFVFDFTSALGEAFGELYLKLEKAWEWLKKVGEGAAEFLANAGKSIGSAVSAKELYEKKTGKTLTEDEWKDILEKSGYDYGGHFAKGGIVKQATRAIIGEAGAEAVVPLENNTEWIDLLADKLGGRGVNVYQTNNYANAHSRYELMQSERNIKKAVKAAVLK